MQTRRIIAVHLLNDYSGSPFVFSQALDALQRDENEVHIFTATPAGKGFLHEVSGAFVHPVYYHSSLNKLLNLFYYLHSQLYLFIKILLYVNRRDLVYINTMLPFGAALAGWLRGCKVIYHLHQAPSAPSLLRQGLLLVMKITASKCLYVSKYLRSKTRVKTKSKVIYNSVPEHFIARAQSYKASAGQPFRVLMISSLSKNKGVFQLLECAFQLPKLHFDLVVNAHQQDIDHFFKGVELPANLKVFPVQRNVHPFYAGASVVVNLSIPGQWNEAFWNDNIRGDVL